ncbi:MAG TPA: aminodeoxychorismate/anthranilate synthase component II [Planctomycetota bacterium]|nr:aminodeoxychorismate/anthranilate synthase component II [Planctomycetota bacterium]
MLIDNYDSFTFNVYQLVSAVSGPSAEIQVVRNDASTVEAVLGWRPTHLVLSPGPGHPADSRLSLELATGSTGIPTLGICLGHQAIAVALGGRVSHSPHPTHGRAVPVEHHGRSRLFTGIPRPFRAGLYHSLAVDPAGLPAELAVTARSASGDIMAIEHVGRPLFGVQFHPESFLTEGGAVLISNFLES